MRPIENTLIYIAFKNMLKISRWLVGYQHAGYQNAHINIRAFHSV